MVLDRWLDKVEEKTCTVHTAVELIHTMLPTRHVVTMIDNGATMIIANTSRCTSAAFARRVNLLSLQYHNGQSSDGFY